MICLTNEQFEAVVTEGIDAIPKKYLQHINNLAFVVEDEPSSTQRQKLNLRRHESLYGLYEGIPLTKRGSNYNLVLPDKITIFKKPIEASSQSLEQLEILVKNTIWHEVAHYYGLDHDLIHKLEHKHKT